MHNFSINLGLSITPESKSPETINDLYKLYNAVKLLAEALDSYTGMLDLPATEWGTAAPIETVKFQNLTKVYVKFDEPVMAGHTIELFESSGELKAKKASAGKVTGFALHQVQAADMFGIVCLSGCVKLAGLTVGSTYYASNASLGLVTKIKPSTSGDIVQVVGIALASDILFVNPNNMPTTIP